MKSIAVVLLASAAVGALASPQPNTAYQPNSYNCYNTGYSSSLPVLNAQIQTSAVENPTLSFSGFISPTTVSDACHCLQTLVRPQLRNEIITVPTVDRIVRTVSGSPVVETINYGETNRLTTYNPVNGVQSESRNLSTANRGTSVISAGYYAGNVATANQNTGTTATRAPATIVATPTSIYTYLPSTGSTTGCSGTYSGNSGYTNTGRMPY